MSAIAVPRSAVVEARTSLALASLSAGLIHVMAGFHHWTEWWLFGLGMFVMAVTQLGAAAWLGFTGSRLALVATIVINVPIIALWVWSRTFGLPFGPEPGEAEAIGIPDAVCTFTELVLRGRRVRAAARRERACAQALVDRRAGDVRRRRHDGLRPRRPRA